MKIKFSVFCMIIIQLTMLSEVSSKSLFDSIKPIPSESGFKMAGYWVWGGSIIKVGSTYHLFASRWPKKNNFPDDYFKESEIVRATSSSAMGPFTFREVVIGERDSSYWDSNMAHNPTIHKIGNEYVLFYIGSDFTTHRQSDAKLTRRIGFAKTTNIEGPWIRCDKPIISEESNNPALLVEPNGTVKLMYRDENLKVKIAVANSYKGPYKLANDNVWRNAKLEDFYLFKMGGKYHFICEDNEGKITGHERWGAHFISDNGINNWKIDNDTIAYNHDIETNNGEVIHCVRRERPQLFVQNKKITHLLNGVCDGENSWCQPVELLNPINLK